MTRPKQMTDGVRKEVGTFCLTAGIYTSILLAFKFANETNAVEKRNIVFVVGAFALASMIYCMIRIGIEGRKNKKTSNQ